MRGALVLLATALLLPAPVVAQSVPDTLTLGDALTLAWELNPAFRRAVVQADASGADVRAGFGAFLPTLNADLGFSGRRNTQVTGTDDFGQSVELGSPITFRTSTSTQTFSGQWTLFNGLENFNNYKAARSGQDATDAGVDVQSTTIVAEVTRRFYDAVQAKRLIEVEEALLEVSRQQLDATERLFRVAARTEVDVLGAQVQVAQQEQALASALGDERKARLRLIETIGLDERATFEVSGELPAAFDPSTLNADGLVATALLRNPRIAQREAQAAQAGHSASAARGRRWPTISANVSIGRSESQSTFGQVGNFNPEDRSIGFGLNFRWPLFTGFQTSQAIAQASANENVAHENLREERLRLEREVRSAHIDLVTAYRRLVLAERAVELSRRRLAMAQEQYQLGTIGFTDFQQIVTSASQDARSWLQSELEYVRSGVTLEELVGEPVR